MRPRLGQRGGAAVADNQVVQEPDIDQFEGRFQPPGDALVGLAGFGDAAWVIVSENDGSGVDGKGLLDDLTGVYAGAINRAAKQLVKSLRPGADCRGTGSKTARGPGAACGPAERLSVSVGLRMGSPHGQRLGIIASRASSGQRAQDTKPGLVPMPSQSR